MKKENFEKELNELFSFIKSCFDDFYETKISNELLKIKEDTLEKFNNFFILNKDLELEKQILFYWNLKTEEIKRNAKSINKKIDFEQNFIKELKILLLDNIDVYAFLSSLEKKSIFVGKNGAGKTRFMNSFVYNPDLLFLKANRSLIYDEKDIVENMAKTKNYSELTNFSKHYYSPANNNLDLKISNFSLTHIVGHLRYLKEIKTIEDKDIRKINFYFKTLFPNKELIFYPFFKTRIKDLKTNDIYEINNLSDGEKSVLLIILSGYLSNMKNISIIIDEPELHINPSLLKKMFNEIILKYFKNIKIVLITHDIYLIDLLKNDFHIELITNFNYPESWEHKEIKINNESEIISIFNLINNDFSDFEELYICEGKEDEEIYNIIFSNTKIKFLSVNNFYTGSGCSAVINFVIVLNKIFLKPSNIKIKGLIDKDYYDETFIKNFKQRNIILLNYSEIENLIFQPEVTNKFLTIFFHDKSFKKEIELLNDINKFNKYILDEFLLYKNKFITQKVNCYWEELVKHRNGYSKRKEIEKEISTYENKLIESLKNVVNTKNVDYILKETDLIKNIFFKGSFKKKYKELFLEEIKNNSEFHKKIQNLIISDLSYYNSEIMLGIKSSIVTVKEEI